MLRDRPARGDEEFSLGLQFEDEQDRDGPTLDDGSILFGYSSNSAEESENNVKDRQRRASQATTSSSLTMKALSKALESTKMMISNQFHAHSDFPLKVKVRPTTSQARTFSPTVDVLILHENAQIAASPLNLPGPFISRCLCIRSALLHTCH
jgi:hypothetical protein